MKTMNTRESTIKEYRSRLPQRIKVSIESSEEGLWARISADDGSLEHCYTQAANITELVPMVNDAVQTHFEVPEEFRSEVGYYSPLSDTHIQLEDMFRKLVSMERQASATGKSEAILTLKDNQLEVC